MSASLGVEVFQSLEYQLVSFDHQIDHLHWLHYRSRSDWTGENVAAVVAAAECAVVASSKLQEIGASGGAYLH